MKTVLVTVGLLATLVGAGAAQGACRIVGVVAPGVSATYDPFDVDFTPSPVPIAVQTRGDDCAGAKLQLALAPTDTSPATGPKVRLVQGSTAILATVETANQPRPITPAAAAFTTNPLSLTVGPTGAISGDATLALLLDPGQVAAPGAYTATVRLLARLTDNKGAQSDADAQVSLSVSIKPSVRVATGGGDLSIDLGELRPGAVGGPVSFDAYANVDYTLRLSSANGFTMRRQGGGDAGVPYTPSFSNGSALAQVTSSGNAAQQARFDAPNAGLRHHALKITVQPFGNLAAGEYRDILTLEIQARL